jgi:hypothetical protein
MKCPGQSGSSWKPEDVFEMECSECGSPVEFFKDDVWRECSQCHHAVKNPRVNLGCAQWCVAAEQCLGDPEEQNEKARRKT